MGYYLSTNPSRVYSFHNGHPILSYLCSPLPCILLSLLSYPSLVTSRSPLVTSLLPNVSHNQPLLTLNQRLCPSPIRVIWVTMRLVGSRFIRRCFGFRPSSSSSAPSSELGPISSSPPSPSSRWLYWASSKPPEEDPS